jgi:hypothetical protein
LGNVFKDSNILNNGYLEMNSCIIEKNTEDDHYLDNSNKKGYTEIDCQIQRSNHYYETINETSYLKANNLLYPLNNYQFDYRLRILGGAPTYLEHIEPVTVHKGEIVHVKPQLWTDSYWPWNTRVDDVILKFRLYNKNGLFVDEHKKTGWFGYASIDIDTSSLQSGDYRLSVSYDGEDPSNNKTEHPIYRSCLSNVAFTVVE